MELSIDLELYLNKKNSFYVSQDLDSRFRT